MLEHARTLHQTIFKPSQLLCHSSGAQNLRLSAVIAFGTGPDTGRSSVDVRIPSVLWSRTADELRRAAWTVRVAPPGRVQRESCATGDLLSSSDGFALDAFWRHRGDRGETPPQDLGRALCPSRALVSVFYLK